MTQHRNFIPPILLSDMPMGKDGKINVDYDRAESVKETAKEMRGRVIEGALAIEHILTVCLCYVLAEGNIRLFANLREYIFDAEFCSFMQKRKMLSLAMESSAKDFSVLNSNEQKELRRNISKIIEFRNIFAHGEIKIECRSYTSAIEYYSGGKKEIEITDDIYIEYEERCADAHKNISRVVENQRSVYENT